MSKLVYALNLFDVANTVSGYRHRWRDDRAVDEDGGKQYTT